MRNLTIHPVEHGKTAEYWLDSGDGELHSLGDLDKVCELYTALDALIDQGWHGGCLDANDERIATWLTIAEASTATGVPETSLRWACRKGYIAGARANPWRVTLQAVEAWRNGPNAKRRKGGQND